MLAYSFECNVISNQVLRYQKRCSRCRDINPDRTLSFGYSTSEDIKTLAPLDIWDTCLFREHWSWYWDIYWRVCNKKIRPGHWFFFLNYARSTGPSCKTRQWALMPTARSNTGEVVQLSGTRLLSNSLPNPPKHTHTHCSVSTGDKPRRSTRSIPMGFERGRVGSQPGDHTTGLSARLPQ